MKAAFVDTQYLVAIFQPSDQWHEKAIALESRLAGYEFVTTDAVLGETLNYFSGLGATARAEIVAVVEEVLADLHFLVVEQTRDEFLHGLALYATRPDKGYSLTDCISMNVMRTRGISEILTRDHHFTQEGFQILL